MSRFDVGDSVRIDIPDTCDPDFEKWHGSEGTIIEVTEDAAGIETGDPRDSISYLVETECGERMHFRWRDLRPLQDD